MNLPRSNNLIRFGAFKLDLRARELRKNGLSTGLPEQSIMILDMLLERPGELVLREEIRSRLWPNDTVVEFDHSINAAVRKLRLVLGESANNPQYIETLARRGYRWIGKAEVLEPLEPIAGLLSPPVEPDASHLFDGNLTGKKISHYRVLEVLGGGGMSVVYKAEDLKLGRRVALKFLPDELVKDPVALLRLEQEARAASALNHPNVCTIYEIADHAGRPFIVMELLEGETLREQITEQTTEHRRPTLDEEIDLGIQISDALAAAHARGIIHRDIKPANIFVTRTGVAKILDFGVAKLSQHVIPDEDHARPRVPGEVQTPERIAPLPSNDLSLTRTGVTMGTAGYMSPEQVRGDVLDSRTDLFSFGLVLYEMATGRAAYGAATAALMREAILHSEPAPARDLNPDISEGLALIIHKALEKDRDKRYQTAAEMYADLEPLRRKAVPRPPIGRGWVAAGGLALLIAATSIIWLSRRQPATPAWPDVKLQQLTTNSWENPVTGGALSPDGRYLAYADSKGMHIKVVGTDDSQLVPQPEALRGENVVWEITSSAWFPDSRRFLANSHPVAENQYAWSSLTGSIWGVSVSGGPPHKLRDAALGWSVSPDGASISFGKNKGKLGEREVWLMGPNGEQARKVLEVDDTRAICCMYFFQDGTRVAYVTTDNSGDTLVARDLKGGPVATLLRPPAMKAMGDFAWLPDGGLIYSDLCNLLVLVRYDTPCNYWIERFDTHSGKLIERARRLTVVTGAWLNNPSATADGRLVAFQQSTGHGSAYVADFEAGATGVRNARHFTLDEGDDAITDWTPDSEMAIIVRNRGDYYALYKQPLTTGVPEPIIARVDGGLIEDASLSPDAKWVILQIFPLRSSPGPGWPRKQIWRVPFGGGALEQLFSVAPGSSFSCARTPSLCVIGEPSADRKQVIVSAFNPVSGLRGEELLRFERYPNPNEDSGPLAFSLSPDGQWLSTSTTPAGPLQILSLRGEPTRVLPVKGLNVQAPQAAWTPDGRGLIVTSYGDEGAVLLHLDLQANVHVLFKCESVQTCFGIPSPDGQHLGIYQTRLTSNIWTLENF